MLVDASPIAESGGTCPRTVSVRNEPRPLSGAGEVLKTLLRKELQV